MSRLPQSFCNVKTLLSRTCADFPLTGRGQTLLSRTCADCLRPWRTRRVLIFVWASCKRSRNSPETEKMSY
ncbi:hypothetical protein NDU88_007801 [Pleurodeles waltl]|uniref:Uncharacterized protein n=1 Tax=Pleurodeles waltl TaxID=8319 RepID=A0AAV7STV5_PLEWA|nr:hypothetical protein NDU88_007801 [Pleurodeles waltl]